MVERTPLIKSLPKAIIPAEFKGKFRFENVVFSYPKDKLKVVLEGLTMEINCKNTGITGPSGCGKSTIFQLMMRLYDPCEGAIFLDGVDLRMLDITWLRQQISYVGQ